MTDILIAQRDTWLASQVDHLAGQPISLELLKQLQAEEDFRRCVSWGKNECRSKRDLETETLAYITADIKDPLSAGWTYLVGATAGYNLQATQG